MEDVKTRHLRRDPRASLVVAESETPLRGVELRTEAALVDRDVRATAVRIATRYVGEAKGTDYVGSAENDVIARLEPGHLRVWDFADEYVTLGRHARPPLGKMGEPHLGCGTSGA